MIYVPLSIWFDMIKDWLIGKTTQIAVAAAVTGSVWVAGYQSDRYAKSKQGVVIHDPGYELIKQENGMFRLWVSEHRYPKGPGRFQSKEYDLYNNPRECAISIAQIGKDRFPSYDASSYNDIIVGDSIFKFVSYDRITAHAALFNSPTIAQCLVRTNDPVINQKTRDSFRRNLPQINDTLELRYNGTQFVLFHSDVDKKGWKEDPHEHRPFIEDLRFDDRLYPWRVEDAPRSDAWLERQ